MTRPATPASTAPASPPQTAQTASQAPQAPAQTFPTPEQEAQIEQLRREEAETAERVRQQRAAELAAIEQSERDEAADLERRRLEAEAVARADRWFVVDLSAVSEPRYHDVIIDGTLRQVKFTRGEPTAMPAHVALKFLRHPDAFKRTDEHGTPMPFSMAPKQPHEMEAGQKFKLERDQTVALMSELHTPALKARVLAIEGGERFKDSRDRDAMIEFLIAKTEEKQRKNIGAEPGLGIDEFTPAPEHDSSLDTGAWAL